MEDYVYLSLSYQKTQTKCVLLINHILDTRMVVGYLSRTIEVIGNVPFE